MSYPPPPPGSNPYGNPYGRPPGPPTQPAPPQQPEAYPTPGYAAPGAPRGPFGYPQPGPPRGAVQAPFSVPGGGYQPAPTSTGAPPVAMTMTSPPASHTGIGGYGAPSYGAGAAPRGPSYTPGPPPGATGGPNGYYPSPTPGAPPMSAPGMPPTTAPAPAFAPPPPAPSGGVPSMPKFYSTGGAAPPPDTGSYPRAPSSGGSMSMPPPPSGPPMYPTPGAPTYPTPGPPTYPTPGAPTYPTPGAPTAGPYAPPPPGPYGSGMDGYDNRGGMGGYQQQPQQPYEQRPQPPQQGQGSRVDPAQIPRPAEAADVITYHTVLNGDKAPPSVARKFVVVDDGNCSPRYLRSTTYYVPQNKELAAQTKLPIALVCRPLATPQEGEEEVPVVDYGEAGPVRCSRCKAYINTFVTFLEHGAKWSCNICGMVNDVPPSYQCSIDPQGQRRDKDARPEFSRGSVEFVVGKEYCVRDKQEPIYVFALDVSPSAVSSGMTRAALDAIAESLDSLPGGDRVRVGMMTFASKLQFYQVHQDASEPPTVILVGDVDDPFSALPPDRWIMSDRDQFRQLLGQIPDLTATSSDTREESASVAALEAVADALATLGGRAIIFTASRPTKGAGAIRLRVDPRDYGTDKEQLVYCPVGSVASTKDDKPLAEYYQRLGDSLASRQICVDVFVCSESPGDFVDVATLGKLTHMTSGGVHYYSGPIASPHNLPKFQSEVRNCLVRRCANESMLKVRTSLGLTVNRYLSRGAERLGGELELAQVNEDQTMVVELVHDGERIKEGSRAFIQLALLYTSVDGRRLVRVHNLALPVASSVSSVFRYADLEALLTFLVKEAVWQAWSDPLPTVRENITKQCVEILYQYRTTCALNSPPGQLILPESLKLLPLYALALIKSDALRVNPMEAGRAHGAAPDPTADERAAALHLLFALPEKQLMHALYPRLYEVRGLPPTSNGPVLVERLSSCSAEALTPAPGIFLLDTYTTFYLYVARDVPPDTLQSLFGVDSIPSSSHLSSFYLGLSEGSEVAAELTRQISELEGSADRTVRAPLVVVVGGSGSAVEAHLTRLLIDDRTKIDQSYVEYLCTVHKMIQTRLNR